MSAERKPRLVGPRVHLCLSDMTSGPRDACPDELHDYPLPSGYGDRAEAAERRLRRGWGNVRCPRCGLYGWTPGRPTGDPCDERIPAPVNDSAAVAAPREDEEP